MPTTDGSKRPATTTEVIDKRGAPIDGEVDTGDLTPPGPLRKLGYRKRGSAAAAAAAVTTATAPLFMLARVPYDTKWAAEIG